MSHPLEASDDPLSVAFDPLSAAAPAPPAATQSHDPLQAQTAPASVDPWAWPPPAFVPAVVAGQPHPLYDALLPNNPPGITAAATRLVPVSAMPAAGIPLATQSSGSPPPPLAPLTASPATQVTTAHRPDPNPQADLTAQLFNLTLANQPLPLRDLLDLHPTLSVNTPHPTSKLTPLHLAAARGYDHLVHTLLDCGALVDALDPELETPLHKACFNGNLYVVEKLVMERANINKRDKHGWAPLHIAAAKNQRLVVDYLLGRPGIDVNLVNEKGMTPLMVASAKGLTGIVRVLLEKGKAETQVRNAAGESAYDLAVLGMHAGTAGVLAKRDPRLVKHTRLRCVSEVVDQPHGPSGLAGLFGGGGAHRRRSTTGGGSDSGNTQFVEVDPTGQSQVPHVWLGGLDGVPVLPGWAWMTEWQVIEDWVVIPALPVPQTRDAVGDDDGYGVIESVREPAATTAAASASDDDDSTPIAVTLGAGKPGNRVRVWARVMRKQVVHQASQEALVDALSEPATQGPVEDYLDQAKAIVEGRLDPDQPSYVTDFDRYQAAIQVLLAGVQDDQDLARKKSAKFLLVQLLETAENLPPAASSSSASAARPLPSPQPWTPDSHAAACHACTRPFTFFLRRHHCRLCGQVFCAGCSAFRASFANLYPPGSQAKVPRGVVRVCETCYDKVSTVSSSSSTTRIAQPELTSDAAPPPPSAVPRRVGQLSRSSSVASIVSTGSIGSLVECPGCLRPLRAFGAQADREAHVSRCLSGGAAGAAGDGQTAARSRALVARVARRAATTYTVDVWQPRQSGSYVSTGTVVGPPESQTQGDDAEQLQTELEPDRDDTDAVLPASSPTTAVSATSAASALVDPSSECLICYESFISGDRVIRMGCMCCFHADCASAWFNKHKAIECPMHVMPPGVASSVPSTAHNSEDEDE